MQIEPKYRDILLEAVEDMMYRIALDMEDFKGGPLTKERKKLEKKQQLLEGLQHQILEQ